MRLSDMNSLNSRQLNENMKRQVGWNFKNLNRMSMSQASAMLESVNGKIYAVKNSKKLHESEQRGDYNSLMLSKKILETYLAEKAESEAQQKAAGIALKHKRAGTKPKAGTASAEMMNMSTKELEKYAGTKHKGIPEKVDEDNGDSNKAAQDALSISKIKRDAQKARHGINRRPGESLAAFIARADKLKKKKGSVNEISSDLAKRYKKNAQVDRDVTDHILNRDGSTNDWKSNKELNKRNSKRTKGINRANKRIANEQLAEGYTFEEQQVDNMFESMMDRLLKMARILREDGALARNVDSIGGEPLALRDAYRSVHNAYDDVSEAHYAAMGHIVDESTAQGVFEDEIGQAESIMAAQDMVDKIQAMLEDVGEMINEQLPPLTDNLRKSNSADRAAQFNSSASSALNTLMDAVRSTRESMSNAVAGLSGEESTPMSTPDADFDVDAGDVDLDIDSEIDDFDASSPAIGGDEPLGRTKRED